MDGPPGARVLCVAGVSERQARLVFEKARRMVQLNPVLAERVQLFQDKLYAPHHDGVLAPLPADADALQGYEPTFCVVDELAVVTKGVWEAMSLGASKRGDSVLLAISTPPIEPDSIMRTLVEYGRDSGDAAFGLVEYAAPAGCDLEDRTAWRAANPALGDWLDVEAMAASLPPVTRESMFRLFRLGQWVEQAEEPWIPAELWASVATGQPIPDGADVVLSLDGSHSQDTTAVTAATVAETPHLDVVGLWQAPEGAQDWRVPVLEVEDAIRAACKRYRVVEIAADPFRWTRTLQVLQEEQLPVLEFPQGPARMTPATVDLYEAVVNRQVTHSGDPRLARHVTSAVVRADSRGTRIQKDDPKHGRRHIDLAVAAVMAHDRARHHAAQPKGQVFFLEDFP
jgi:phage terminase large subunit-like protein